MGLDERGVAFIGCGLELGGEGGYGEYVGGVEGTSEEETGGMVKGYED